MATSLITIFTSYSDAITYSTSKSELAQATLVFFILYLNSEVNQNENSAAQNETRTFFINVIVSPTALFSNRNEAVILLRNCLSRKYSLRTEGFLKLIEYFFNTFTC